ncbi:DUF6168 family protein [Aestuariibaculum sediminum]|uniref:Uncharacterized protein n=1 Tax=Aestuariibaculum sediminum TaxID=2770637 RepID=A0A8J6PYN6_9FLAO|nr:DUF6168 family protein [Aestuariibaculum sediminum]MBD0831187.1 hypothetical protein [Aestuariibaculum sediminum]
MIKRILIFVFLSALLFALGITIHGNFIVESMAFELSSVYLFHAIAVIIVYAAIEGVAGMMPDKAGYAYLTLMFIKLGLFVLLFKNSIFESGPLSQTEKLALVVPLFLFLILEAVCIAKLLNNK